MAFGPQYRICWGFRVDKNGRSYAHCVDTEATRITPAELGEDVQLYRDANLMVFDGQYTLVEVIEKVNWGQKTPGVHRGLAAYFCHNSYVAEVMDIVMEDDQPRVQKVWCAVDCGIVINKDGAVNMIQGGVVDGIGHGMYSQLTFENGTPAQNNFDKYQLIRHSQAPKEIEVFFVENEIAPTGLGEPGLPPAVGALANAMYKATGRRVYNIPFVLDKAPLLG